VTTPAAPAAAAPIGVFDSGLGGLSVVREMLRRLPGERVVYVGDTAHVPYGGRPLDEVRGFATAISRFLVEVKRCKAVVMACNTSSTVAPSAVQARYPDVPILGVILPGAKAAAERAGADPIAVLATEGTVKSGAYARALLAVAPQAPVTSVACPRFVPLVEAGCTETAEAMDAAREYLERARTPHDARVVILGCTHYPFLLPVLAKAAGPGVTFVDPAGETVRELAHLLGAAGLAAPASEAATHTFYATGDPGRFADGMRAFLGDIAARTLPLRWKEGELFQDDNRADDEH
jgi:glutamate racemase